MGAEGVHTRVGRSLFLLLTSLQVPEVKPMEAASTNPRMEYLTSTPSTLVQATRETEATPTLVMLSVDRQVASSCAIVVSALRCILQKTSMRELNAYKQEQRHLTALNSKLSVRKETKLKQSTQDTARDKEARQKTRPRSSHSRSESGLLDLHLQIRDFDCVPGFIAHSQAFHRSHLLFIATWASLSLARSSRA